MILIGFFNLEWAQLMDIWYSIIILGVIFTKLV